MKPPNWYDYFPESDSFKCALASPSDPIWREARKTLIFAEAKRLGATWRPLRVSFADYQEDAPRSDFPSFSRYRELPFVSLRAWKALEPLLGDSVEPLPVDHKEGEYFLLNILKQIPFLDVKRSQVHKHPALSPGEEEQVIAVYRYAIFYEKIAGLHMVRTPLHQGAFTLVDEAFRQTVERNGLTGLRFEPLPLAT